MGVLRNQKFISNLHAMFKRLVLFGFTCLSIDGQLKCKHIRSYFSNPQGLLAISLYLSVAWPTGVQLMFFFCSGVSKLFGAQGSPSSGS